MSKSLDANHQKLQKVESFYFYQVSASRVSSQKCQSAGSVIFEGHELSLRNELIFLIYKITSEFLICWFSSQWGRIAPSSVCAFFADSVSSFLKSRKESNLRLVKK
jgi:hypothetical protein